MAHWIDAATELPEPARAHFRRYLDIPTAWQKCDNGVFMIWLVRHFGTAGQLADAARVAGTAVASLRNDLDTYFRSVADSTNEDPLALAYRDVMAEVSFASATSTVAPPPLSQRANVPRKAGGSYGDYRAQALRQVAEALRHHLAAPEP